jgi:hypothetical protein
MSLENCNSIGSSCWAEYSINVHLANPISIARCEADLGCDSEDSPEIPRMRTGVHRLIYNGLATAYENGTRGESPKICCDQQGHELSEAKKRIP